MLNFCPANFSKLRHTVVDSCTRYRLMSKDLRSVFSGDSTFSAVELLISPSSSVVGNFFRLRYCSLCPDF